MGPVKKNALRVYERTPNLRFAFRVCERNPGFRVVVAVVDVVVFSSISSMWSRP